MNPIFLDLGFIKIYWYSIMLLVAFLLGSYLIYRSLKHEKLSEDKIVDMLFYTIICGLIGARIYYVLFNLSYYAKYPFEIFEVWNGGLAIHGGIIGGLIYLYLFSKKNNINILKLTDIFCVSLIIGQAIGRWGNFFNGEAHGYITTYNYLKKIGIPNFIINGMYINKNYYLPTFYFEFIWDLLGFIVLLVVKKYYKKIKVGNLTGIYLIWYSFGRFFIEALRTDSLMIESVRVAQLISVFLFIIGIIILFYKRKDSRVSRLKKMEEKNGKSL